jgi:plastocyanin
VSAMVEIHTARRLSGLLALTALLLLAGCGSSGGASSTGATGSAVTSSAAVAAAASATMTISNFTFSPTAVPAGATVAVVNEDPVAHTVTIADVGIDVQVPANGRVTFTAPAAPGTYRVTCDFHPNMKGGLTVT